MRTPVYRTRSGVDVYVDRTPAGGTEQYGIRRSTVTSVHGNPFIGYRTKRHPRFEYVLSADLDPFEPVLTVDSLAAYDDWEADITAAYIEEDR